MTRTEYEENVVSFGDLIDFCYDNGMDNMDDIMSGDSLDEYIWDEIRDFNGSWESLRDLLSDIRPGYDYYRRDGWLDYAWLDDTDFDNYKSEVAEEAEDRGFFEDEEEETGGVESPSVEEQRRKFGYYFTDPLTGEVLVAGMPIEPICVGEIDSLFQ